MLNKKNKDIICNIFSEYLEDYSHDNGRSLGWESTEKQILRFEILKGIGDFKNKKILDIGCGTGDFYDFLINKNGLDFKYVGLDLLVQSINIARIKNKYGAFYTNDIDDILDGSFDYVTASGIFAVNFIGAKEVYFSIIKKLYSISKIGFAFNMLNSEFNIKNANEIIQFPRKEVFEYCNNISSNNAKLIDNYLPIDFTIYMYH